MSQPADTRLFKTELFTHPSARKPWRYLILDAEEEVPVNRWFKRRSWKSRHCVRFESQWTEDWETFSEEEMVEGVTERNRTMCFFLFSARRDFRVFLERDPASPDEADAIKVMASATFRHIRADMRLGYLSSDTARALKGIREIDARPYSVYLPRADAPLRVGIRVLIRTRSDTASSRGVPPRNMPARSAAVQNGRGSVFEEVYAHFNTVRDKFHCHAVAKSQFREAFDPYFDDALEELCLAEADLDNAAQAGAIDVDLKDVMINEMLPCIVETLVEAHPHFDMRN